MFLSLSIACHYKLYYETLYFCSLMCDSICSISCSDLTGSVVDCADNDDSSI
jgi:hypothetical protein